MYVGFLGSYGSWWDLTAPRRRDVKSRHDIYGNGSLGARSGFRYSDFKALRSNSMPAYPELPW